VLYQKTFKGVEEKRAISLRGIQFLIRPTEFLSFIYSQRLGDDLKKRRKKHLRSTLDKHDLHVGTSC